MVLIWQLNLENDKNRPEATRHIWEKRSVEALKKLRSQNCTKCIAKATGLPLNLLEEATQKFRK